MAGKRAGQSVGKMAETKDFELVEKSAE